jgi:hypothetical protein
MEQVVARKAHNLEVAGSSPAPATKKFFKLFIFLNIMKTIFNINILNEREEEELKSFSSHIFIC